MSDPLRIVFLIRALSLGGAERQLVLLAEGLARRGHSVVVVVFYPGLLSLQRRLTACRVPVLNLGKRGRWDLVGSGIAFRRTILAQRPDVVYSFLPTANVLSAAAVWPLSQTPIVWGVRASSMDLPGYDWLGKLIARMERWLKSIPDFVICNSRAGFDLCRSIGFRVDKLGIVRNMIDLEANFFDADGRRRLRTDLDIAPSTPVIGVAGRLDPMKGIDDLLAALPNLHAAVGPVALIVAGEGKKNYSARLRCIADELDVAQLVHWLGRVDDMRTFYSAVDVFCSPSSCGEGTSNVLAEALACERICVATRVGDSADLVADESLMAEPHDVAALGRAILTAVSRLPEWDGSAARLRIAAMLSADVAIAETECLLRRSIELRNSGTSGPG